MLRRVFLLSALLAAKAGAESASFNFHLEPGAAVALNAPTQRLESGMGAALKLDLVWLGYGPVAPQVEAFGVGFASRRVLQAGSAFGAGIGVRLRLLDDHEGYLLHWGPSDTHQGNWLGNVWLDVNLVYAGPQLGFGVDSALGLESSLIDGLQVGPFAKFSQVGPTSMLIAGLSVSVGAPDDGQRHNQDLDGDGVVGAADKCPTDPEDKDGFEDDDGCPEDDNDRDGVPDADDWCENEPEDKDGYQDEDGCPEDDDKDGVPDDKDQCRREPEDKDGFKDDDGCPDPDNDQDGLLDGADKCPSEAEDKDGFQDDDGCPDPDNDQDGLLDGVDKCPNEAETLNGKDDDDGCPEKEVKVFIEKQRIVITEKVFFEFNKSRILPKSDPLLRSVAEVLTRFPQVKKVSVEGHTDDVGTDDVNLTLSEKRAQAVLDALVKFGIDKSRLEAKGHGKARPLQPGVDEASREKNRRVEFVIVDPAEGLVPVEVKPPAP